MYVIQDVLDSGIRLWRHMRESLMTSS